MECTLDGPYWHAGLKGTDEQMMQIVRACREAVGEDFTMMVDVLPAEMCDSPLRRELVNDPLIMEDGVLKLPDRPGLGIELNQDALEKYTWRESTG
jgi:L-alanine-DL-glutamate epimerase-like enolase superfamily enzyme